MKFLCLAYGDEKVWNTLSKDERDDLLAQDEVLRKHGDYVAAVDESTVVRTVDGKVVASPGPFARGRVPLAGFSLIEARDLDEAKELVSRTPCAVAGGAVEIWPVKPAT
jgi:hypothetical protein